MKEACKNKTRSSAVFQAIIQSTDDTAKNKSCAGAGSYNDFRSTAIALLNATTPNPSDVITFVDSLPGSRVRTAHITLNVVTSNKQKGPEAPNRP